MDQQNWHGRLCAHNRWPNPKRTRDCEDKSRPEYTEVRAHEYRDTDEVLKEKIKLFAHLVKQSKNCVAYTGAGLSVASGLDDYATKAKETITTRPHVAADRGSGYLAFPNKGHEALARLYKQGYLKKVVNQNHDCLLQKSGFPQHAVNEIHGSWFDPSNPGGNILRDDLFDELLLLEEATDLCVALGTSLSGLNADRLAKTPAKKYPGKGFGLIIVTLQETQLDSICTLRIFATLDEVMTMLAHELVLPELPKKSAEQQTGQDRLNVFTNLPYNPQTGKRSTTKTCSLDLNEGSRIKILLGSYAGSKGVVGKKTNKVITIYKSLALLFLMESRLCSLMITCLAHGGLWKLNKVLSLAFLLCKIHNN